MTSKMPAAIMSKLAIAFLVIAILPSNTNGHAFISVPKGRQAYFNQEPQSWNQPGSLCGKFGNSIMDNRKSPIQETYKAGQEITVETTSTAFHKGYVVLRLCPDGDNLSESCFANHVLEWSPKIDYYDAANPERLHLHDRCNDRTPWTLNGNKVDCWSIANSNNGGYLTRHYISESGLKLPDGVTCEHCVLQWVYYTDVGTGEKFWNCADIKITPSDGTSPAPATAAPTPAPTALPPAPTVTEVPPPTSSSGACDERGYWPASACPGEYSGIGPCRNDSGYCGMKVSGVCPEYFPQECSGSTSSPTPQPSAPAPTPRRTGPRETTTPAPTPAETFTPSPSPTDDGNGMCAALRDLVDTYC